MSELPYRVLFVDDDPGILEGLRNSLFKHRREWQMVFARSAAEALIAFERQPFELVISDMRMPCMDGAALLATVKARYPASLRIMLSGQADQAAILKALPVTHQFIAKPCEPAQLSAVIARGCAQHARLSNERLEALIGGLAELPSTCQTYSALRAVTAQERFTLADVVSVVERDTAMCAKLLQLVNSAYFGVGRRISSTRQAVGLLGVDLLSLLALSTSVFSMRQVGSPAAAALARLQQRALAIACLMRRMFPTSPAAEEAFTTGLLHGIGEIVLFTTHDERTTAPDQALSAGLTHAEVGAYLLSAWGLPLRVVEAVAQQHRLSDWSPEQGADGDLLAALHVASTLLAEPLAPDAVQPALDLDFLQRAGALPRLEAWRLLANHPVLPEAP